MSSPKNSQLTGDVGKGVKGLAASAAKKDESTKAVPASTPASSTDKAKLSTNELKELKKAEKAARRAKVLEQKTPAGAPGAGGGIASSQPGGAPSQGKKESKARREDKQKTSTNSEPARCNGKGQSPSELVPGISYQDSSYSLHLDRILPLDFSHMPISKPQTVEELKKVDLAVRSLGLQMLSFDVLGSNARMVAMLTVFRRIFKRYKSPENQALTRHLIPQVLNPQISHLVSCRPLSICQGNAIRWLKLRISQIDVNMPEEEAKEYLCNLIDDFIRDKSTLAHQVIANIATEKIVDGDVILTYARSTVVEKTIKKAWADGKKFSLIIIDSSPLHEGKALAKSLLADEDVKSLLADRMNGIRITIGTYAAVGQFVDKATKVLLGASAMMSNGYLYSRSGTFGVALEGSTERKPVIVLCESVKFCSKAPLSSYDYNELAPVREMLMEAFDDPNADEKEMEAVVDQFHGEIHHRLITNSDSFNDIMNERHTRRDGSNGTLSAFNPMYDLTPSKYIDIVITEHGRVPPGAIQILHKRYNEDDEVQ